MDHWNSNIAIYGSQIYHFSDLFAYASTILRFQKFTNFEILYLSLSSEYGNFKIKIKNLEFFDHLCSIKKYKIWKFRFLTHQIKLFWHQNSIHLFLSSYIVYKFCIFVFFYKGSVILTSQLDNFIFFIMVESWKSIKNRFWNHIKSDFKMLLSPGRINLISTS